MISISHNCNPIRCPNGDTNQNNVSGKGSLKFTIALYPERIDANDSKTILVFIFRLENVGDNNVRVLPPKHPHTIFITLKNSRGDVVPYEGGDYLLINITDNDTIALISHGRSLLRDASVTESSNPWSLFLTRILNKPDNYTFTATYTTYEFDNKLKNFNKITLDYWHGNLTSNSVALQAY
jgi:hypothetical protein